MYCGVFKRMAFVLTQIIATIANGAEIVDKSMMPSQALPHGQAIYERYCVICHQDGVAGAPKFRFKADWQPRLSQKTLDVLQSSAIKGFNSMPAKGSCIECSDLEIKQAIEYMLPQNA